MYASLHIKKASSFEEVPWKEEVRAGSKKEVRQTMSLYVTIKDP
jgi:hypothetical protein